MSEGTEWLTVQESLDFLTAGSTSFVSAKQEIADGLRDGRIASRADRAWVSASSDVSRGWKSGLKTGAKIETDKELDIRTWRDSVNWIADMEEWRWPEGRFYVTISSNPIEREFLLGVQFLSADIKRLRGGGELKHKKSPGRPPDHVRWTTFWMEVVALAQAGRLTAVHFPSQAELTREIDTAMGDAAFNPDHMKPRVAQIYQRFIGDSGGN